MSFANQFKLLCALPLFSGLLLSVMFLVGYFNGFTDPAFTGLFYVHVVALAFAVAISFLSFIQLSLQSRWHVPIALFSLFFFVAVSVALGALPAVSRDALIHHLAVPKLWLQSGAVTEISWHEWSYYPMLLQIGFVGFLQNGLVGCTPLYHASYLWICAGILSLFVFERHKDSRLAIVAHLVLLSLPICFRLSTESLVDLGLVLYCGIATVLALEWADGKRPLAGCIGVGLALGFACATKYNGMLFAALFLLCLLQLGVRAKRGALSSLMFSVGAGTLCFLVFLPWLVKNMIWIGNPVHPLFRSLFEHVARTPGGVGMASPLKRFGLYGEDFLDYLLTPFRMLFFGMDDSPQWFDGQLTPILVLGFLAILGISKSKHRIFLLLVTVSYVYLGLFLSGPRIRYLLPVLVPWVLLCVSGLKELGNLGTEKQRPQIYGILLTLHLLFSGYYVVDLAHRKKAIPYFAGALNEEDYVSLYVPEYSLAKFANSKLQGKGTIYLLYTGNRFWVYDVPIISGGYQSAGLLLQWLERARDASEFSKDLQNRGIHYILANGPLTARALREVFLREGPELAQKWQEFQSSLVLIQQDGPYGLFEIPSGAIDSPLPEKESEWTIKN